MSKTLPGNLQPGQLQVIKRNGDVVSFDQDKISIAIKKAYLAVDGDAASTSSNMHEKVERFSSDIFELFQKRLNATGVIHIEEIQDQVELALMRAGEQRIARAYVLYREERLKERKASVNKNPTIQILTKSGELKPLDLGKIRETITIAAKDLEGINVDAVVEESVRLSLIHI